MKLFYFGFLLLVSAKLSYSQTMPDLQAIDTINKSVGPQRSNEIFYSVEQSPEFPGGIKSFNRFLNIRLQYPEIANLIGINGKVDISFVVAKDGSVTHVLAKNCVGAGCDEEAVEMIESSPRWKPGIQNGNAVSVHYDMPITFTINPGKVKISDLKKSDHGFIFNIKGALYTTDEAEAILGPTFESGQVDIAVPFYNYNQIAKFNLPDKKDIYLIIFKTS